MRVASVALVAGLAAVSNAFLIPPTFPEDAVKDTQFKDERVKHHKDLIHALLQQATTVVDLDCPDCPFALRHSEERGDGYEQSIEWMTGIENKIHLEFETPAHSLTLNNQPIFPLQSMLEAGPPKIKATQIRADTHEQSVPFDINFAIEQNPSLHPPVPDVEVFPLTLTILAINGYPIKADSLNIHLVKTPGDEYTIAFIHPIPYTETPGAEECEGSAHYSFCRAKAMIAAHLASVSEHVRAKSHSWSNWLKEKSPFKPHRGGCGKGRKPHHGVFRPFEGENQLEEGKPAGHHRGGKHHHHHHHGHRYHRLGHMMHQTLRFFVIPALLGVIGGLTASAVGMLVGRAIVLLWCRLYRDGQRGPLRREVEYEIVLVEDEKEALLVAEMPAEVEELPAYTDVEAGENVDEKH